VDFCLFGHFLRAIGFAAPKTKNSRLYHGGGCADLFDILEFV
jgi:hypothetical protein